MLTHAMEKKRAGPTVLAQRKAVPAAAALGTAWRTERAARAQVREILRGSRVQAKLKVNQPGDAYEQEADRVADQVMRMPDPVSMVSGAAEVPSAPAGVSGGGTPAVQRKCAPCASGKGPYPQCAEEESALQRKPFAETITPLVQRQAEAPEEEEEIVQAKRARGGVAGQVPEVTPDLGASINSLRGGGQPLSKTERNFFEPRFGADFSHVRLHTNARAAETARSLNARAFTLGSDITFGPGQYSSGDSEGRNLLAHELVHTVQQDGSRSRLVLPSHDGRRIQRRLVTFGTTPDVNAFLGLLGPQAGLTLVRDPVTSQARITAVLPGAPPSPTLRARLTAIINNAAQHAEVVVARGQPLVAVGAFPQPTDLTVTRVQRIDIDDILAVEAGAPGNGVALAMHEIEENFQAHGVAPAAGVNRFPAAHQQAINLAESPVAAELVGPGRRIAQVTVPGTIVPGFNIMGMRIPGFVLPAANTLAAFLDYENYYLGFTVHRDPATLNAQVTNAGRFPRTVIPPVRTIDNFATGSNAFPAAGAATIAAVVAVVAANPTATVQVQGFTDNVGSAANNLTLSQQRADSVRAALQGAGVNRTRIHSEGLGETAFVAPNLTAADRARNRRVVITVARPQL